MKCRNFTTPYKGNLSSSITFDPDLGDYLEKDQQKQLSKSFHLTMGRASGVSTLLLGIDFPKADSEGIVWGLLGPKSRNRDFCSHAQSLLSVCGGEIVY